MGEQDPAEEIARFDTSVPHIARVYDYWLGGKDNFAADRAAAEQVIATFPDVLVSVRAQRAFLARAVNYLVTEAGIRQFLDIGTGLPASNNTHEVARRAAPESRIVYVDNDHCKPGCVHRKVPSAVVQGLMGHRCSFRGMACAERSSRSLGVCNVDDALRRIFSVKIWMAKLGELGG